MFFCWWFVRGLHQQKQPHKDRPQHKQRYLVRIHIHHRRHLVQHRHALLALRPPAVGQLERDFVHVLHAHESLQGYDRLNGKQRAHRQAALHGPPQHGLGKRPALTDLVAHLGQLR